MEKCWGRVSSPTEIMGLIRPLKAPEDQMVKNTSLRGIFCTYEAKGGKCSLPQRGKEQGITRKGSYHNHKIK